MTIEIAYKVLELENNASIEEVKAAYARLSKVYHPEENPKEFQQIHEAYVTLTRGGRRANRATVAELSFGASLKNARKQQEETRERFDFDASIQQAQRQEEEMFQQQIQMCVEELAVLFSPPNYNKLKKFKEFFGRKEYGKVFFSRPFIYHLAQYINQVELKHEVYSYFIKIYGLKNETVEELIPEAQQLYRVIDSRYSIKQDVAGVRSGAFYGLFGGVLYVVLKLGPDILKIITRQHNAVGNELNFWAIIPFIIIGLGGWILYKIFCKKHNIYVAMKKVAGWLFVFSIPVYVFDLWAPFMKNNPSNSATIAMCTIVLSAMWWVAMKLIICILEKKRVQNDNEMR